MQDGYVPPAYITIPPYMPYTSYTPTSPLTSPPHIAPCISPHISPHISPRISSSHFTSQRIGTVDNIPSFVEAVKARKEILFGFGHRVYKNYDPRATIIRQVCRGGVGMVIGVCRVW